LPPRQPKVAALAAGNAGTEQRLGELHADLHALNAQIAKLEKAQSAAALEAQRAPLTGLQRGQVKELAAEGVREAVPGLVAAGLQRAVPPMIDEVRFGGVAGGWCGGDVQSQPGLWCAVI